MTSTVAEHALDVIITHEYSDFDAIASLFAASRIYPQALPMEGRGLQPLVRDFLALHRDRFQMHPWNELDAEKVRRVIVVDVRQGSRLPAFASLMERAKRPEQTGLEIHLWDHHPATSDTLVGSVEVIEPVGATVTLLVEEIQRRKISIDTMEATLFALGIHHDTGSLTYASTTARDAAALAWLLQQGARITVISRYLQSPMNSAQRQALKKILGDSSAIRTFSGVPVAIIKVAIPRFVDDLALVVEEAMKLENHPALFCLFHDEKSVQVIARSQVPYIHVGAILEELGGGGHAGAAALRLKSAKPDEVEASLIDVLRAHPLKPRVVSDLMSSPVHTVSPDLCLGDLDASLLSWQHTGVPVLEDGVIVGLISRRDVEKARARGDLRLPVSSCMSHKVQTIAANVRLEDALDKMVAANIGRLPVVSSGQLLGIITRSDVLSILYPSQDCGPENGGFSQ